MRRTELLNAAAETMEAGQSPFDAPFLVRHEVSLDECMTMATQLAIGARIVAEGLDEPRSAQGIAVLDSMARHL